jgi:uncharacterized membrane protein
MITTIGVFTTHTSAESALNELRQFGVSETDLSYVYVNSDGKIKDGQGVEKVESGAATGAILGVALGLVVANGILPGLETLIIAGPLAVALGFTGVAATAVAGAVTGAVAGGLIGALTGLGIEEQDVYMYEDHVKRGGILVIARETPASTDNIFMNHHATNVKHYMMNT